MRAGDKILNYIVTRRIKAGGMGVVFEGEQSWGSRRKVAIKQLLENLRDDEMIRRRFIREAEILEMLDDPRIVKILGFDHEQDAFIMEFIDGQTLSDLLKQDPHAFRQPEVLVRFMTELLDAFAYAHNVVLTINDRAERGIVHRDIKPSNIIVQPDMRPKILDFGISRIASFQSTLTDPKMQMGSVPFMSPEQIVSPTDVDWRSDIYSLGLRTTDGQWTTARHYTKIGDFDNGVARVETSRGPEKYLSKDGKTFTRFDDYQHGVATLTETNGRKVYLTKGGNWLDEVKLPSNQRIAVRQDQKWGYLNMNGQVSNFIKYEKAGPFDDDGTAEVTLDGKTFRIDKQGKPSARLVKPKQQTAAKRST